MNRKQNMAGAGENVGGSGNRPDPIRLKLVSFYYFEPIIE
jgi:hypothetical protein